MANTRNAAYTREQLQRMFEKLIGGMERTSSRTIATVAFIVARRWQLTIVFRDGKVTRILDPATGLIGP